MLVELRELCDGATSTVFCAQYPQGDWCQGFESGVHAEAIMDRIGHHTIWIEARTGNMGQHAVTVNVWKFHPSSRDSQRTRY